jgi:hypothetical protein
MSRWIAILLLLFPLSAFAQDQVLNPDGDEENAAFRINGGGVCSTRCDAFACDTQVDEGHASPDGNIVTQGGAAGQTMFFDFPTPSANPSTSAGAQNFDITVSRCDSVCDESAGGTDPTYDIAILCNGVLKTTINTAVTITGLDQNDATNAWTFTSDGDCPADGSTVQVRFTSGRAGGGGSRRWACIEAVTWDVTHASAATAQAIVVD